MHGEGGSGISLCRTETIATGVCSYAFAAFRLRFGRQMQATWTPLRRFIGALGLYNIKDALATARLGKPKDPHAGHRGAARCSLCIGMLVGIEREWANKEFGLRSFAFVSVLGMLSAHLPTPLATVAFVGRLLLWRPRMSGIS